MVGEVEGGPQCIDLFLVCVCVSSVRHDQVKDKIRSLFAGNYKYWGTFARLPVVNIRDFFIIDNIRSGGDLQFTKQI